jgi:anti-sigma factor RsiW
MSSHVADDLAAFAEDQLDAVDRERVSQHLAGCKACRDVLERVRDGIALASQLGREPMPPEVAARIRKAIDEQELEPRADADAGRGWIRWWQAAAAAVFLIVGVALYWQLNRPWVRLEAASGPPTRFEREGRELHDRLVSGNAPLTFASRDEDALWQWLAAQGAPVTSIRVARPEAERAEFVPIGAAVQTFDAAKTSVLAYRIDGRPVTLTLALARDVPDAPAAGWWTKRVTHRRDASGRNTLTWTVGGGTYVMVSELEGAGQRACLICHTAPAFRQRLLDLRQP